MSKPPLNIEMDRDLPPGIGWCRFSDGTEVKILVPDQTPPAGTVSVRMSIEDFGRLLAATRDAP